MAKNIENDLLTFFFSLGLNKDFSLLIGSVKNVFRSHTKNPFSLLMACRVSEEIKKGYSERRQFMLEKA
jgi:hypothetical protein